MTDPISRELTTTQTLRHELTTQRHRELEDEMAQAKTTIDRLKAVLDGQKQAHKLKVDELERQLKIAATISHNGFEMLPTEVTKTFDPEAKTVTVKRLDTKQVTTRAMEKADTDEWHKHVSQARAGRREREDGSEQKLEAAQ